MLYIVYEWKLLITFIIKKSNGTAKFLFFLCINKIRQILATSGQTRQSLSRLWKWASSLFYLKMIVSAEKLKKKAGISGASLCCFFYVMWVDKQADSSSYRTTLNSGFAGIIGLWSEGPTVHSWLMDVAHQYSGVSTLFSSHFVIGCKSGKSLWIRHGLPLCMCWQPAAFWSEQMCWAFSLQKLFLKFIQYFNTIPLFTAHFDRWVMKVKIFPTKTAFQNNFNAV